MDPSFVSVRDIFVEYTASGGILRSFLGRKGTTHSVLRGVTFSLNHGDQVTVFGTPGSGKSTLLRVLAGILKQTKGTVTINGKSPTQQSLAAGYISTEESEPEGDTVSEVLHSFGRTHRIKNLPAKIGAISELLNLQSILYRPASRLSSTERLYLNIARAALADTPLVLFDDTADQLGTTALQHIIGNLFANKTVVVATHATKTAEQLELPILLLHSGQLAHFGTCDAIANSLGCVRIVDAWVEGLRYDLLRSLRAHSGIEEVRLLPTDRFDGQRIRLTVKSARYLPGVYDLLSRADLVKVQEVPASLSDVLAKME